MNTDTPHYQGSGDRTARDPRDPAARLAAAEKQITLALDSLSAESEAVDAETITETEAALEQTQTAQEHVDADRRGRSR